MIVDLLIFHFSKWTDKNPNLQVCCKPEKGDSPCYRKGIWSLVLTFLHLLNINNPHPHVCLMGLLGQSRFILILWRPQNKALKGWTFPIPIIQGKKVPGWKKRSRDRWEGNGGLSLWVGLRPPLQVVEIEDFLQRNKAERWIMQTRSSVFM